jgi:negative regulator of sigma-B (phosphoserine phosphatase)
MNVEVAHLSSPMPGEQANGDAVVVRRDGDERLLIAVIDGLGHGPVAAEASLAAVAVLERASFALPVLETMQMVHEGLRHTRGAVATICIFHGRRIEACAVGNVQVSSTTTSVPLVLSPGVLGHRVPKFRVCSCDLKPGTRLALASDGISTRFRLDEFERMPPAGACKAIFTRHRRLEDDATILIADMDG